MELILVFAVIIVVLIVLSLLGWLGKLLELLFEGFTGGLGNCVGCLLHAIFWPIIILIRHSNDRVTVKAWHLDLAQCSMIYKHLSFENILMSVLSPVTDEEAEAHRH